MNRFVYTGANEMARYSLLPMYMSIKTTGAENAPLTGPLIVATNHLNDGDPGILATRINRKIIFMAKSELFRVPILGQFLRAYGAIPVRRGEADLSALRRANEALEAGFALCIFPEGTREGRAEQLREGWPGAGLLALRTGAPILPIGMTGSGGLSLPFMFLRPWEHPRVTVNIGEPFHLPRPPRINAEAAREGTRLIMERIAALLPPDHRGYYGDAPDRSTPGDRYAPRR